MITILGLGFTGQRLARRLLRQGVSVAAAVRGDRTRFQALADSGLQLVDWPDAGLPNEGLPKHSRLLHSIPPLPPDETAALHALIEALEPSRVVYISTTGVYGSLGDVNEDTPAAPSDARGVQRVAEEAWVSAGPWNSLILRAAAIYGPGRGIHTTLREGRAARSTGVISRIHVDDLAALTEAALFADLRGAWPVGDDYPCPSGEIIHWLVKSGEIPMEYPVTGRRVDGRKIRELLGVELKYPSWKTGIPACLSEEDAGLN